MADKRITDVDFIDSLDSNESFFINKNNAIKQINKSNVVFGISNGGTGATTVAGARNALGLGNTDGALPVANGGTGAITASQARLNLGAISALPLEIVLSADKWEDNKQTVSASGVTTNNIVFVSPSIASHVSCFDCGVICTSQSTNALTFTCDSMPSADITINVVIFS